VRIAALRSFSQFVGGGGEGCGCYEETAGESLRGDTGKRATARGLRKTELKKSAPVALDQELEDSCSSFFPLGSSGIDSG